MDGALHNNSSFIEILFTILSSFVEFPVFVAKLFVDLSLWTGWASEPCTSAPNEPLPTFQIRPYSPVDLSGFDKEVAIIVSFQFENLREQKMVDNN